MALCDVNDSINSPTAYVSPSPLVWSVRTRPRGTGARPLTAMPALQGHSEDRALQQQGVIPSMQDFALQPPSSGGSLSMHIKLAALKLRRLETRRQQLFEDAEPCAGQDLLASPPSRPTTCGGLESHSSLMRTLKGSSAVTALKRISSGSNFHNQTLHGVASLPSNLLARRNSSSLSAPCSAGIRTSGEEPYHQLLRTDSVELDGIDISLPFQNPATELNNTIHVLNIAAAASRLDLDWQAQLQAIQNSRRLLLHHPELVVMQLHPLLWGVAPAIDDLRSSVSKSAMNFLIDVASKLGHALDGELEALLPLLIRKAGSASLGRDNFLAMQADKVLVVFMTSVSPLRFTGAILMTAAQKGPKLRSKVASLLATCLDSTNGPRLVEHSPTAEKMLLALMSLQKEGQLDTRMFAKQALAKFKELLSQGGMSYNDVAARLGCKIDHAERVSTSPRIGGIARKGHPVSSRVDVSSVRRCSSVPLPGIGAFRKF